MLNLGNNIKKSNYKIKILMIGKKIKVAVVGDVHDQWCDEDEKALFYLGIDLVLFVGDFGNESVDLVERVARLTIPKAVILGNHDAWFSATKWGKKKAPYDHRVENRVQKQLDLLGDSHVGYGKMDFPHLGISVVGSRPFSWGGSKWKCEDFLSRLYGVSNFEESSQKIFDQFRLTSESNIIFLGHNGPFGLGGNPEDSCGKDWNPIGGDFGDPDFQSALKMCQGDIVLGNKECLIKRNISLVTFGHMHHRLRHTKERIRTIINRDDHDIVYLNSACTPRVQDFLGKKARNFSVVVYNQGQIEDISLIWVTDKLDILSIISLFGKEDLAFLP